LIQAEKADPCDFLVGGHYHWLPDLFASGDEQNKLIDAQLDAMNKREASGKSCALSTCLEQSGRDRLQANAKQPTS
jgi:hypothetical protein